MRLHAIKRPALCRAFLFLLLTLLASAGWADACAPSSPPVAVTVAKVIDGDTLQLKDGRRVRLIGINAPERGRDGRQADPYYAEAAQALRDLIGSDRRLWLQAGADRHDRHGRLLAHGFRRADGGNIEAALLRQGLALQVVVPPNTALSACLQTAEREARGARAGLWRTAAQPLAASRLQPGMGGFQRVRGTVQQVEESRHSWWLDLDGPIVLRLDKRDLHYFGSKRPADWQGRTLTIRGWVSDRSARVTGDRKPLVMPLRHPAMVEQGW